MDSAITQEKPRAFTVEAESQVAPCPNCLEPLDGNFCSRCGQKRVHAGDLSLKHALHHVFHEVVHLDGKIFTTLKLLLTRPGQLTLDFIEGRRARHVHPIRLFLVFFFLFFLFAPLNDRLNIGQQISAALPPTLIAPMQERAQRNNTTVDQALAAAAAETTALYKPIDMIVILIQGFVLWILFGRRRRYLAENYVMGLHLASFNMVMALTLGWTMMLPGTLGVIGGFVLMIPVFIYFLIAARRVYGGHWGMLVLKYLVIEVIKGVIFVVALTTAYIRALSAALGGG